MILGLHLAALAAYVVAWAFLLRAFRHGGGPQESAGWRTGVGAVLLHGAGLAAFIVRYRTLPLVGLGPASSALALAISTLALSVPLSRSTICWMSALNDAVRRVVGVVPLLTPMLIWLASWNVG